MLGRPCEEISLELFLLEPPDGPLGAIGASQAKGLRGIAGAVKRYQGGVKGPEASSGSVRRALWRLSDEIDRRDRDELRRSMADTRLSSTFNEAVEGKPRVAVVGGGYLGSRIAAELGLGDCDVTIYDRSAGANVKVGVERALCELEQSASQPQPQ